METLVSHQGVCVWRGEVGEGWRCAVGMWWWWWCVVALVCGPCWQFLVPTRSPTIFFAVLGITLTASLFCAHCLRLVSSRPVLPTTPGVHGITTGALLSYPNIRHVPSSPAPTLSLMAANGGPLPVRVVARSGSVVGPVVGVVDVQPTGGWDVFRRHAAPAPLSLGPLDTPLHLVLTFGHGAGSEDGVHQAELLRLDAFSLE